MLIDYQLGQTGIVLRVKILNSSVSTGAGLTGLTNASSGLIISTIADNEATATAYTVAASNVETVTTLGTYEAPTSGKCRFKEVDSTNHKGVYEVHIANARYAVSGARSLLISISGASNAAETDVLIPLRTVNPYAADGGLTLAKTTNITGFNDISAEQVNAEADAALAGVGLTLTVTGRIDAAISSRMETFAYTAPLDAAGTRTAIGMTAANLDTQLAALAGFVNDEVAQILTLVSALPTADQNADAVLDRANGIETGITPRQALRLTISALGGILSGAEDDAPVFEAAGNPGTTRIEAVVDSEGNRTGVTLTL